MLPSDKKILSRHADAELRGARLKVYRFLLFEALPYGSNERAISQAAIAARRGMPCRQTVGEALRWLECDHLIGRTPGAISRVIEEDGSIGLRSEPDTIRIHTLDERSRLIAEDEAAETAARANEIHHVTVQLSTENPSTSLIQKIQESSYYQGMPPVLAAGGKVRLPMNKGEHDAAGPIPERAGRLPAEVQRDTERLTERFRAAGCVSRPPTGLDQTSLGGGWYAAGSTHLVDIPRPVLGVAAGRCEPHPTSDGPAGVSAAALCGSWRPVSGATLPGLRHRSVAELAGGPGEVGARSSVMLPAMQSEKTACEGAVVSPARLAHSVEIPPPPEPIRVKSPIIGSLVGKVPSDKIGLRTAGGGRGDQGGPSRPPPVARLAVGPPSEVRDTAMLGDKMRWNHPVCDPCSMPLRATHVLIRGAPGGRVQFCGWCAQRTESGLTLRCDPAGVPYPDNPPDARCYVAAFRSRALAGVATIAGPRGPIRLERMSDAEAVYAAGQCRLIARNVGRIARQRAAAVPYRRALGLS